MIAILLVEATSSIVLRTLVIVVNIVKLWHHASSISFLAFKQGRIHWSFSTSVASTFTSQSRCVKSVIARWDAFTSWIEILLNVRISIFVFLSVVSRWICIDRRICLNAVSRILIVDLLECILIKVYWTLPMRSVLTDQLSLVGHLSALRKVIYTLGR